MNLFYKIKNNRFFFLLLVIFAVGFGIFYKVKYIKIDCSDSVINIAREKNDANTIIICAKQGSANAMRELGLLYEYGKYLEQDLDKAIYWYKKGAELDEIESMIQLHQMYREGRGVNINFEESLKWAEQAASTGNQYGILNLGMVYEMGEIVPQDHKKALDYYNMAEKKGSITASYKIAKYYLFGLGATQNYLLAKKYFDKIKDKGTVFDYEYNKFYNLAEFMEFKIRKSNLNSLIKIHSLIKGDPVLYDKYKFDLYVLNPLNTKIKNLNKGTLLFNQDGYLEYAQLVYKDSNNYNLFYSLRDQLIKKYSTPAIDLPNEKLFVFEVGYSIIDAYISDENLELVITLRSSFLDSLSKKYNPTK